MKIRNICAIFPAILIAMAWYGQTSAQEAQEIFPTLKSTEESEKPAEKPVEKPPEEKGGFVLDSLAGRMSEKFKENFTYGGYIRNETAYRFVEPVTFDKVLNIVQFEGRYTFSPRLRLTGRLRAFYDAVYDLEDIDTISPRKGPTNILPEDLTREQVAALEAGNLRDVEFNRAGLQLKELYLDYTRPNLDIRFGKQIVRWGVVEGSRVTDEINPLDFTELILRDIDDRYIPLIMLKTDVYIGDNTIEGIWIPEVRGHEPAPKESEWEQFRFLPGLVKPKHAWENPVHNFRNSEWALKFSRVFTGLEASVSYFRTWDDFPSSFRTFVESESFGSDPRVDFTPEYKRLHIYGATVSKSISRAVFNAEAAYVRDKFFGARFGQVGEPGFIGEKRKNYVKYAFGFDVNPYGVDISPAIIQQYIFDYEPTIIQKRLDTVLALFARKEFAHNVWAAQILLIYFPSECPRNMDQGLPGLWEHFTRCDWLIRPRAYYNVTDRIRISGGVDFFEGDIGSGLPGEFHFIGFFTNNDRVYLDVTFSF